MTLAAGARLGPYEIASLLGAGGMGEVYRARDPRLSREVAIKVLPASTATDLDSRRRFEQEARAIGSLNHPNLLAVFDIGEHEGSTYVVFELLEGTTLRERLRPGPLPAKKALDFALQIAQGLAAAHEKGIVHRDLKPENVFVTSNGGVKILDFGLAKLRPERQHENLETETPTATAITDAGTVLGTVGYMSPEQVQARPVDNRSDIFSFGTVLYEMLSGKQAFRRDSAVETMNAILKEDPLELSRADNSIPPALERILGRCLEKKPDQRFRSAHDLAFALDAVSGIAGSGLGATPPTSAMPWGARRWQVAAAIAAAVLATGVLGLRLRSGGGGQPSTRAPAAAIHVQKLTNRGDVRHPAISPEGRYLAYSFWDVGTTIRLRDIAEKTESRLVAPFESEYFGNLQFARDGQSVYYWFAPKDPLEGMIYEVPLIGGDSRLVHAGGTDFQLSPDEKRLALSRRRDGKWRLFLADVGGGQETDVGEAAPQTLHVWSPDSSEVLFGRKTATGFALLVVKGDGTGERKLADLPQAPAQASWHPRGDGIAVAVYKDEYESARLFHIDAKTGATTPLGDRLWRDIAFGWLPDGSALIVNPTEKGHDVLYAVSYPEGRVEKFPADTHDYRDFSLTADGSKLVSVQTTGRSDILISSDPEKGTFNKVVSGTDVEYRMCWTPDGRLVYSSNDGGSYDLHVSDADGSNRKQLTFDRASDETQPAASPDGRYVVFVSDRTGEQGLYRINLDGTGLRSLTPEPKPHFRDYNPQVTPDSQWVLYQHWNNGPSAWRISIDGGTPVLIKGARPAKPTEPTESAFGASASPDGKSLAFYYFTQDPRSLEFSKTEIAVASLDGVIVKRFPFYDKVWVAEDIRIQWSRDSSALYYRSAQAPNLMKQPIAGGPPVQVTHFEEPLGYFDWSLDGKKLAVSRSSTLSDVVLVTNFR